MTRTELDIRRALEAEPDHDAVRRLTAFAESLDTAAGRPAAAPRSTVRRFAPLLAAAAVAALAVGGALVLQPGSPGDGNSGSSPDPGPFPTAAQLRPTWDLAVEHVAGYRTQRTSTDTQSPYSGTYASVTATSITRPEKGDIQTCHSSAGACFKQETTPQRVSVAGHQGLYFAGQHVGDDGLMAKYYKQPWVAAYEENEFQPLLVWNVDARTTVLISGTFGFDPVTYDYDNAAAKKIMLKLAAATRTGRHDDIAMPFALRDLPSHLAPESVFLARGNHCIGYGNGQQALGVSEWVGEVITACRVTTRHNRAATIKAADDIDPKQTAGVSVHDFADGTSVVVEVDSGQQQWVTKAQRERLAAVADVSPRLADPSTWLVVR